MLRSSVELSLACNLSASLSRRTAGSCPPLLVDFLLLVAFFLVEAVFWLIFFAVADLRHPAAREIGRAHV